MMDPASIIGTTAAALQFLKLITKISTGTWRAFSSTKTVILDVEELREATAQFKAMADNLENQLQGIEAIGTQVQLRDICKDCLDKARELHAATSSFADKVVDGGPLRPVWEALKSELGFWELDNMAETLADHQRQLNETAVICLWEDSQRKQHTLQEIQNSLTILRDTLVDFKVSGLRESYGEPAKDSLTDSNALLGDIHWDSLGLRTTRDEVMDILIDGDLNHEPLDPALDERSEHMRLAKKIARSFEFAGRRRRHDDISEPYESTFQWIWKREPEVIEGTSRPRWSSFPKWLEGDDDNQSLLYWITGRPGSGKSTLMRFIEDHEKLRQHLARWRPDLPLYIWNFYAWNPGSEPQKSIDGLVKSILAQALQELPHLVPVVVPRRWAFSTTLWGAEYPESWEKEDLNEEALYRLLAACRSRARLVILIDGLDEFEVEPKGLLQVIQRMSTKGSTKICVASRPWPQFMDHFRASPSLAVHDLTKGDIETYVTGRFRGSAASEERPEETMHLQRKVIGAAGGVFQWVTVVVNFLVNRLEDGEPLSTLLRVIEELPEDLSDLYSSIWSRITQERRLQAEEIFALKAASGPWGLHYVTLWAYNERDAIDLDLLKNTAKKPHRLRRIVSRFLGSRTLGLLDIDSDSQVTHLHRTVAEWTTKSLGLKLPKPPEQAIIQGLCTVGLLVPSESHLKDWPRELLRAVLYQVGKLAARPGSDATVSTKQIVSYLTQLEKKLSTSANGLPVLEGRDLGILQSIKPNDFIDLFASVGYEPFVRARLVKQDLSWRNGFLYHVCFHGNSYVRSDLPQVPVDVRMRLVRLCLDGGAPPSRVIDGEVKICTLKEAANDARNCAMYWQVNEEDKAYYNQVADMLETMAPLKGLFVKKAWALRRIIVKKAWAKVRRRRR